MTSVSFGADGAKSAADKPLSKTTHVYKTVGDVKVEADVYRPEGAEVRPVVVWIHGGALIVGSRTQVPKQILDLCTRERFVFVSLDYRLAPEVKLPQIAADLQDAFRWLHEQGPKLFGADTRRIVVTGGSAGGFLTMLSGVLCSPKPTALVAYWGYGDIDGEWTRTKSIHHGVPVARDEALAGVGKNGKVLTNTDDPAEGKARGGYYRHLRQTGGWSLGVTGIDAVKEPGKLDRFCPVKQITRDYPPILMIHGTKDTDVPYFCSTDMVRELTKHGVKHELLTLEGAEHGLRDGDPKRVAEAHARALEFIKEQLSLAAEVATADGPPFAEVPEQANIEFVPARNEEAVPEHFRLKPHRFEAEAEFVRESGSLRTISVTFPSPVETIVPENNTVYGEYFQPAGAGPFPGVVVLHILGGEFPLSQTVASSLARAKVAALFIKMPYYGERRSQESPRRMISRNPRETSEGMTQAVLDVRRAGAWLAARPEVDKQRLGVTGISLGGIMSALSAAGEPRFRKVAIYLGGGKLGENLWSMEHRDADAFRAEWIKAGESRESFLKLLEPVDPATHGRLLKDRDVLMVNAKTDEIIPHAATMALWDSIGTKPELVWLDAGHITAAAYLPGEMVRLQKFFTAWKP